MRFFNAFIPFRATEKLYKNGDVMLSAYNKSSYYAISCSIDRKLIYSDVYYSHDLASLIKVFNDAKRQPLHIISLDDARRARLSNVFYEILRN